MSETLPVLSMPCTVAQVETALLARYPRAWAEPWDHVGLAVGDPEATVERIAVALDATSANVRRAAAQGAQLLVTHHPVCLETPRTITPPARTTDVAAGAIWEAVRLGVALVAMHTNLDRSREATGCLPGMLGLAPACGIEQGRPADRGRLGSVADLAAPESLDSLARRCAATFGRVAQVYGDPSATVARAAFFTGSLGASNVSDAICADADVVVCGECGYHHALELEARGCAVIILGHDASELPLADVLAACLVEEGLPQDRVVRLPETPLWHGVC